MTRESSLKDIQEIKKMMSKSSKFNSISGSSGIFAGTYLLIGAVVYRYVSMNNFWIEIDIQNYNNQLLTVLSILFAVFLLSLGTLIILTINKAKKNHESAWNATSKRMLVNFCIPFVSGSLFVLLTLNDINHSLSCSLMLIFYGLTLVNGSKYTLGDLRFLGLIEIVLGLINVVLPTYSFWLFTFGFGLMNIIYGFILHFKYDRK